MTQQIILNNDKEYSDFQKYILDKGVKSIFLVCGKSFYGLKIGSFFRNLVSKQGIRVVQFNDFTPNPTYESIEKGIMLLKESKCELIIAAGGGSTMDVAKCIKLYHTMDSKINYLEQTIVPNELPLMVIPTTAGSGSEATRFAVIYYRGVKKSVVHESCIPEAVLFDDSVLDTLPIYQRKATMLDALCHALESYWSVNSTQESKSYSKEAIRNILGNYDLFLKNDSLGNKSLLLAANLAGKAINITQTTAGHAMCYKLTGLYGLAHGHAAALCVYVLWKYMLSHTENCIDYRGETYLQQVFLELAEIMNEKSAEKAVEQFGNMLNKMEMEVPDISELEYAILRDSVDPVRLKNNPVKLSESVIELLYRDIESLLKN